MKRKLPRKLTDADRRRLKHKARALFENCGPDVLAVLARFTAGATQAPAVAAPAPNPAPRTSRRRAVVTQPSRFNPE